MEIQLDPEMDMTKDIDIIKGNRGVSWWMTNLNDLPKELFKKYVQGHKFLDVGSGDGRVISFAMLNGALKCSGVEIDQGLIKSSKMQRHIKNIDYRDCDFSNYDVIYYYLGSVESYKPENNGEIKFVNHFKNFKGVLILYHRKVTHRLEKFHQNLINIGFTKKEEVEYVRFYEK